MRWQLWGNWRGRETKKELQREWYISLCHGIVEHLYQQFLVVLDTDQCIYTVIIYTQYGLYKDLRLIMYIFIFYFFKNPIAIEIIS